MRIAVYPGSFDPVTLGHLDVIRRATEVFDQLVVAVLINPRKAPLHTGEARVAVIVGALGEAGLGDPDRIRVVTFDGLTVDLARQVGAGGLRTLGDFESELQMAHMNRRMAPHVDTVFLMTNIEHADLSSSLVREIAAFGGDVSGMVPDAALPLLRKASGPG